MKDRIATHPGRVTLIPVSGQSNTYDMTMADQPTEEGTPLNKALFDRVIAAVGTTATASGGTDGVDYTLAGDGGFTLLDGATIRFRLHTTSGASPKINVNGTGQKYLRSANGVAMQSTPAGAWVVATYSSTLDFFVLASSAKNPRYTPLLYDAFLGYSPLYLEVAI